jgi:MFS family permease
MTGIFSGASPVSKAYLADIGSKDEKLPRYLALKDASSTMAFILGPAAGGLLFDIRRRMINVGKDVTKAEILQTSGSLSFVIAVSAAASMLAAVLAGSLVKENNSTLQQARRRRRKQKNNEPTPEELEEEALVSCPLGRRLWAGVASVCAVSFLFNVGDSTFHAFYSAFLRNQGISTRDLGLLFTSLAFISFGVSSTSASAILKSLGPVWTCAFGLTLVGSGLFLLGLIASGVFPAGFAISAAAAAVYFCGVPIYGPTIPTMLLRCVPPHRRGFVLGLDGSTNTLARILSPLVMGEIYRRYDAGTAFSVAGISAIVGACIALVRRFLTLRQHQRGNSI